jgi:DNA-binding CsgD family transcriptional regulator
MTAGTALPLGDDEQFRRAVHAVQRSTGAPVAFAGPASGGNLQLTQFLGTRTDGLRGLAVARGAGLGGRVTAERRPAAVNDYGLAESITHDYDDPVLGEGLRAVAAAPVAVRGEIRGVLYTAVRTPEPLGDRALQGLVDVADRLAGELAISDDVDRRLKALQTGPPGGEAARAEEIRELHTELRTIAQDITDARLRARLQRACEHLAHLGQGRLPERAGAPRIPSLSPRELDALSQVALGCSNAETAEHLGLRPETVKAYLRSAMRKLNAHTRHAAVIAARKHGLLP